LSGVTVLIVEDDVDNREALGQLLMLWGAHVLLARSGADALTILESATPDVVLCDLSMPDMDGFVFLGRVRQNRRLAHLPVIAVTALGSPADVSRTRRAGFADHFMKPIDVDVLVARLEQLSPRVRDCAA
jgi:two-component system CheB/CheR fusion protein